MTQWSDLQIIQELLVVGFFGSDAILSLFLLAGFSLLFVALTNFRYALGFILPAAGAFVVGGWLGASPWVLNSFLLLLGLLYAFVILRITGNMR